MLIRIGQALALLFEGMLAWLLRPRVIILIILFVLVGGITYWYFDVPASSLAVKRFALKTLPRLMEELTLSLTRLVPKIGAHLSRAFAKVTGKRLAFLVISVSLTPRLRRWLREVKEVYIAALKYYVAHVPKIWWRRQSPAKKVLLVSVSLALLGMVIGAQVLGLLVLVPFALLKSIGTALWTVTSRLLTKVGLGRLVVWLQRKAVWLAWKMVPESTRRKWVLRKWRAGRAVIRRREKLRVRAQIYLSARRARKQTGATVEVDPLVGVSTDNMDDDNE